MSDLHDRVSVPESKPAVAPTPAEATAENILALRHKVPIEPYDIPGVGRIWLYGLTDWEASQWLDSCKHVAAGEGRERIDDPTANAKLLVLCVRSRTGSPLFTAANITQLIELPNVIKSDLIDRCTRLSGLGGKADAEILKNFATTLTAGS